jgi:hypothetical protein
MRGGWATGLRGAALAAARARLDQARGGSRRLRRARLAIDDEGRLSYEVPTGGRTVRRVLEGAALGAAAGAGLALGLGWLLPLAFACGTIAGAGWTAGALGHDRWQLRNELFALMRSARAGDRGAPARRGPAGS